MDRLSTAFETSARRWELIVYPSLFAFIILAAYGFYLVFSLAKDVHYLAISVDSNMTVLSSNMQAISDHMGKMAGDVGSISGSVENISTEVAFLEPIKTNMDNLDRSIRTMSATTQNMQNDMSLMNYNVSRPMSFMNTFMPW
jgi:prophage DNA circulation protein